MSFDQVLMYKAKAVQFRNIYIFKYTDDHATLFTHHQTMPLVISLKLKKL